MVWTPPPPPPRPPQRTLLGELQDIVQQMKMLICRRIRRQRRHLRLFLLQVVYWVRCRYHRQRQLFLSPLLRRLNQTLTWHQRS